MTYRMLIVCLFIWSTLSGDSPAADQSEEKLPPLNVSKQIISFDPKTVEVGAMGHFLGLMEVRVTILGRSDKNCLFEYSSLGCGGISATQRIEVPIGDGPVVFDFSEVATGANSLPKSARVIERRARRGHPDRADIRSRSRPHSRQAAAGLATIPPRWTAAARRSGRAESASARLPAYRSNSPRAYDRGRALRSPR